MTLLKVESVVRDRLGLDPGALGPAGCPRAVESRMRAMGLTSLESYLELLTGDAREVDALAAELVVHETWFFRGGRALFERLAEFISERASSRSPGIPVRALSLPCSTGEEPYSLAIALHERGVPPAAYRLLAADLSAAPVDRAIAGLYSAFAFREVGPDVRSTCFRQVNDRWALLPHVRQAVRFRTGNVTDPSFGEGESPFDLILCRNLFIYLTAEARSRAMTVLDRLLVPDGWLCLTPAEADRLPPGQFVSEGPIELGIYRRAGVSVPETSVKVVRPPRPVRVAQRTRSTPIPSPVARLSAVVPEPTPAVPLLATARTLADAGQLAAALATCEELIRARVDLPDVHTLMGVIHQAEGRIADAAEAFRKALYLNPEQSEALSHVIILAESRGDVAQAATLRKRLARLAREDQA